MHIWRSTIKSEISTIATAHIMTVESHSGTIEHTYDKINQSHTQNVRQSSWDQLRDTTRSKVLIWVKHFQNESMVEIYSKNLARAIGKVLCMKFS